MTGYIGPGLLLAFVMTAQAQEETAEDTLLRATTLSSAGNHRQAIEVLRQARSTNDRARLELQLALSLSEVGELREAYEVLRALAERELNPLLAEVARERLSALDVRLPVLTLRVHGEVPAGLRAYLDGTRRLRLDGRNTRWRIDPGTHRLDLRSADDAPLSTDSLTLREGERRELWLGPFPDAEPALSTLSDGRPPAVASGTEIWPWVVGIGVGATALIALVVAVGVALAH